MFRAGFRWLLCGFEAANERILDNINKKATLADNDRCVALAKAAGLKIKALMSVGHPGESEETIEDVRNWLIRNAVDDFDCTVITTYPGTPYYDLAVPHPSEPGVWTYTHPKTGDRLHSYEVDYTVCADYYKGDPDGGYRSFVFTDHLSAEQLVRLRDTVERDVRAGAAHPVQSRRARRCATSIRWGRGCPASSIAWGDRRARQSNCRRGSAPSRVSFTDRASARCRSGPIKAHCDRQTGCRVRRAWAV